MMSCNSKDTPRPSMSANWLRKRVSDLKREAWADPDQRKVFEESMVKAWGQRTAQESQQHSDESLLVRSRGQKAKQREA